MRFGRFKTYIVRLYIAVFVLFMLNKFVLRPFVLGHDSLGFLRIIVLSIPNTFEAILGMINVASVLIAARLYLSPRFDQVQDRAVYLLATAFVSVYVLTQEFKLHNLGGRNTYDPYDAVASVVGVVGMLVAFLCYGVIEAKTDRGRAGSPAELPSMGRG